MGPAATGIACGSLTTVTNHWNIAIEAAAVVADDHAKRAWGGSQGAPIAAEHIATQIRKLRVDEVAAVDPSMIGAAGDEALCPPTERLNCADALHDHYATARWPPQEQWARARSSSR